ncbi:MAG: succinate dehydrogenase, cytochrome b556 subunit [Alphaproteobacteria bacterium]|nr:succinate dehydrogenase, cytochrome b556 subunit [Alphaproteobacteria bacterium]
MTSPAKPRPLSPHLQIYKPQISSVLSIFHRMTGVALAFGLIIFVGWLVFLAGGPQSYAYFISLCQTLIGKILLLGFGWAFFYHFCCGIRHLCWDAGWFLSIRSMYVTGYLTLLVSFALTLYIGLRIFSVMP